MIFLLDEKQTVFLCNGSLLILDNNYRINRIKDINNKSDYELIINNIKKILNKISNKNYEKLKNEFICYYNSLCDDNTNDNINKNNINIYIFESLVYNNIIFNNLYSDLLYNLININSDFSDILNNNLDIFYNIYKYIKEPSSSNNHDDISYINKHNDKYKCFCNFYIFSMKINLIPIEIIFDVVYNLQDELLNNIKLNHKKYYNELITEFIFLIISNIETKNIYQKILDNLKNISQIKNNNTNYPGISNKIIFKHKDIVEKYIS